MVTTEAMIRTNTGKRTSLRTNPRISETIVFDITSVISVAMPGAVFDKVLSNAQEAKARDARLIGVAPEGPDTELFDDLLPVPAVEELLSPLLTLIPMQLLSYHIAARRGLDVDQPRNLAKSVTVE